MRAEECPPPCPGPCPRPQSLFRALVPNVGFHATKECSRHRLGALQSSRILTQPTGDGIRVFWSRARSHGPAVPPPPCLSPGLLTGHRREVPKAASLGPIDWLERLTDSREAFASPTTSLLGKDATQGTARQREARGKVWGRGPAQPCPSTRLSPNLPCSPTPKLSEPRPQGLRRSHYIGTTDQSTGRWRLVHPASPPLRVTGQKEGGRWQVPTL